MKCLFCEIIKGNIPAEVVYEDEDVLAFKDINPTSPIHILFIPKNHFPNIVEARDRDLELIKLFDGIRNYLERESIDKSGYRLVINAGEHGQQTVDHLHVHLLAGRQLKWPAG